MGGIDEYSGVDHKYIASICPLSGDIGQGKGSVWEDDAGKEYIDLTSGIAVNTFGIADDEWLEAVKPSFINCSTHQPVLHGTLCQAGQAFV